ncbi:MAG: BTAD domain-containing putative transcriptional regulator [Gemmatimonadaceae bacterium]
MMRDSEFRLITLGRLALVSPAGIEDEELNTRRRKVALLAVLALAKRPISRDALLEMFWGDQDEARARHSLSDAISHLRRIMGRDVIVTTRSEATVAAESPLAVDAIEFADAVAARDYERAIVLYAGPFLDGVYVGGSSSFEDWVARERSRLESLFFQASAKQCLWLAREQRWDECAALAARWLEAAPLSSDAALFLMKALKAPGTSDADWRALEAYERLRTRLARDFELTPDKSVQAVATELSDRLASSAPPEQPATPAVIDVQPDATTPVRELDAEIPSTARNPPVRDARRKRLVWGALAAVTLAALSVIVVLALRSRSPPVSPTAVAVLPFAVRGNAELDYLREGMVDLLSTNLDGAGGVRSVDPRAVLAAVGAGSAELDPETGSRAAERLGAGMYVLGDIVQAGARLRITASLYERSQVPSLVSQAAVEGNASDIFALVDGLAAQLLAERMRTPGGRIVRIAAMTTNSLPALKAYLEGESHWRAVRLPQAIEALQRAVALDSTFALAWYRLGVATSWEARVELARDAMDRAMRHRGALPPHDRLLIEAYDAIASREMDRAERLYRAIVADHPNDVEAWGGLGEMWFHANPWRGRSFTESRQAWERMLQLEPNNAGATWHLAQVAARERRYAELDSLLTRLLSTVSGGAALSVRAMHTAALGDVTAQAKLAPELRGTDDYSLIVSVWRVAVFSDDLPGVTRFARLLTDPQRLPEVRALGHVVLAHLELAQGRWSRAQAELDALATLHQSWALEYRALLSVMPALPMPAGELETIRDQLRRWNANPTARVVSPADLWVNAHADDHTQLRTYLLGLVSARLGDVTAAQQHTTELARLEGSSDAGQLARSQGRGIRAQLLWSRKDPAAALRALEAGPDAVDFGSARTSPFYARTYERFMRAELLRAVGRDAEALGWYRGLAEIFPYDIVYLALAHRGQAEIYEKLARKEEAVEHYGHFVRLWRECDAALRPMVIEAERRMIRLQELSEP